MKTDMIKFVFLFFALVAATAQAQTNDKPNIVYVMCDDLGFGDVKCFNPKHGKIPTPSVDRLAQEGMIFTDAHSGSSVCTPTRYGVHQETLAIKASVQATTT